MEEMTPGGPDMHDHIIAKTPTNKDKEGLEAATDQKDAQTEFKDHAEGSTTGSSAIQKTAAV